MKKRIWISFILAVASFLIWGTIETAQTSLFDQEKSRQDIQTMRAVLRTTLSFALKSQESDDEVESSNPFGGLSQIAGYYLYGQGAVFTISLTQPFSVPSVLAMPQVPPVPPVPPVPAAPAALSAPSIAGDDDLAALDKQVEAAKAQAVAAAGQIKLHQKEIEQYRKEALKHAEEVQKHMKKWKADREVERAKMAEQMTHAQGALVEALAKHGDSMTVVKPQEYVTLILLADSSGWGHFADGWFGSETQEKRPPRQILSVQKSVVTDYKAGRLTLEEFKKKVLSYTN